MPLKIADLLLLIKKKYKIKFDKPSLIASAICYLKNKITTHAF